MLSRRLSAMSLLSVEALGAPPWGHCMGKVGIRASLRPVNLPRFEHMGVLDAVRAIGIEKWGAKVIEGCRVKDVAFAADDCSALFHAHIERLSVAMPTSDVKATANFAYACERTLASNYLRIGHVFSFIDPVFSSGLMLAMLAGDLFEETPIWRSIAALKGIFYRACLLNFKRNWQAIRQRRTKIRVVSHPATAVN